MSTERYLACPKCLQAFWMGCDGFSGPQFLYGNPPHMKAFGEFIDEHWGHGATFMSEHAIDDGRGWEFVDDHVMDMHRDVVTAPTPSETPHV
jgi:hypothetical protein